MKRFFNLQFSICNLQFAIALLLLGWSPPVRSRPSRPCRHAPMTCRTSSSSASRAGPGPAARAHRRQAAPGCLGRVHELPVPYLDVNGDGVLSKDEAERAPTVALLSSGPAGGLGGQAAGAADGGTDRADDGGSRRRQGRQGDTRRVGGLLPQERLHAVSVPLRRQPGQSCGAITAILGGGRAEPSVEAVSKAIFELLDTDKDGKLTKEELAAAPEVLLRLDEDEDEMILPRELVPTPAPTSVHSRDCWQCAAADGVTQKRAAPSWCRLPRPARFPPTW